MDIESIRSDEFYTKLRERMITIEEAKNPDKFYKSDYTSVDLKLHTFLDNLQNILPFFLKYGQRNFPEEEIIRLAELFVCRPGHLKRIYNEIEDACNSAYDYKGLIYSESDYEKNDDVYADYKALFSNLQSLDECVCVSVAEKEKIGNALFLILEIIKITKKNNIICREDYLNAIKQIEDIGTVFFDEIKLYKGDKVDPYSIYKELSIELYMDFIETIVRVLLMYYLPIYVNYHADKSLRMTYKDAFKLVLDRCDCIYKNLFLIHDAVIMINDDGFKHINIGLHRDNHTIPFEDQIKRFVYYLERCSKYNEALLTMDSLQNEIDFDYDASQERIIRRFKGKAFTLEQLMRYRDTDGNRKVNYTSKEDREVIESMEDAKRFKYTPDETTQKGKVFELLDNATKNNNNDLLYCSKRTVIYREIYVWKNPSILLNESATKIINDLSTEKYDWESYHRFLMDKSENITDYDVFRAKRKCRRQLNFLDQKFIRGFFYTNNMVKEYNDYIEITRRIYIILLKSYLFFDYDMIFSALRYIAVNFLGVFPLDSNQNAPVPIIHVSENNTVDSFIVTYKKVRNKRITIVKKKRGRKRIISEDDDKKIESLLKSNPFLTIKKIMEMLSLDVTEEAVRLHLKQMGFQYDRKTGYSKKSDIGNKQDDPK